MSKFTVANNRIGNQPNPISIGLSLGLLVSLCAPAFAQNTMDQDSLLPPEVVPLDPNAASRMTQSQAQYRAANMTPSAPSSSQSIPGLGSQSLSQEPVQSAQEFRNQAFNSLYNQGTLAPPAECIPGSLERDATKSTTATNESTATIHAGTTT